MNNQDDIDYRKRPLIAQLRAEMRRIGGKDYQIQYDRLGADDLLALLAFVRDCETEQQKSVVRQRMQPSEPWRR